MEKSQPALPLWIISEAKDTNQQSTAVVPPPPPAIPPPLPPSIPSPSMCIQPTGVSETQDVLVCTEIGPSVPGTESNDPHMKTEDESESSLSNPVLNKILDTGGEDTEW